MIENRESAQNLVEVIQYWISQRPEEEVFRFYPQGEGEFTTHSYQSFQTRCQSIASKIQHLRGERIVLLYQSGIEFLEAFFACFYAGVTAVPAYPPRRNHNLDRLISVINDCKPAMILSAENVMTQAKPLCDESFNEAFKQLPWINTDQISMASANDYTPYSPAGDEIAFLQYTSGSTGNPKGVMVSHRNLMINVRMAEATFDIPSTTRSVSWLPLFHDMGLIGAVMMPLYWGGGAILMPPAAFLQKPIRWLNLISEHGKYAPIGCAAPNFSFQICVDQISDEDLTKLDLSNWVFALSGAEPIRATTIDGFADRFASAGFKRDTFAPSFGMAECTLLSTSTRRSKITYHTVSSAQLAEDQFEKADSGQLTFVSSGTNCSPQEMCIVNPETLEELGEHKVGELWLKGDHIAQGYWGQPELSEKTFHAYTSNKKGPYLRTGDLAAIVDGNLYITGRRKDLLIIRGKNHYPQDIELTTSSADESLHLDNAAAFTIDHDNEEKLVIVAEVLRQYRKDFDAEAVATIVRNAVAKAHGVEVHSVVFIRFASIPKTSSGKIQRFLCKKMYLNQELKLIGSWENACEEPLTLPNIPDTPLSEHSVPEIAAWIQQWLAVKAKTSADEVPLEAAIDGLGLDSVDLVQLTGQLESWLGQGIDHVLVWEQPHILALAENLHQIAQTAPEAEDDSEVEGFI